MTAVRLLPLRPAGSAVLHHRWKSTAASAAASVASSTDNAVVPPTLTTIPTLPYLGTFLQQYSKTPKYAKETVLEFWPEMKRRFGSFYRMGMPGIGADVDGKLHIIQDPQEMSKLLRQEGEYPVGSTEFVWPPKVYGERNPLPSIHLIGKGPEWKRMRTFVQTDMLSPKSAAKYLPAALEAARHSSQGAPHYGSSMNDYVNYASFDMFVNIMLGHLPRITDPNVEADPVDAQFCDSVAEALRTNNDLSQSIYHKTMVKTFGIDTEKFKHFVEHFDKIVKIARAKVERLQSLRETSPETMTLQQRNSYVNQAMDRELQDDTVTADEAKSLVAGLITAGVDTTGNMLTWRILHIATHPEVQEKLYQELIGLVDENGHLTEETITPRASPYLHACMRESHRCGNAVPVVPIKKFETPVTVHGVELPAGSVVALDAYSTGMDPELVEDPQDYRPERFLKEAVQARKGTPSEIIDHAFFSGPFSQGARRCPGSRVANLEAHAFIAQLVLDWKMSIPSLTHWTDCPYGQDTLTVARLPKVEFEPRN